VTVSVKGDTSPEADETFLLNLSSSSAGGARLGDGQGAATITNDDAAATSLSISDAAVVEGRSGTRAVWFTLTLSAPSTKPVSVRFVSANGTALDGSDYVARVGTVSIRPGGTSATVAVSVRGDRTVEPDETFVLDLSGPRNTTLADAQGVATITNDD
jgi:hypothetical protein